MRATDTDPALPQMDRSALGLDAYLRYVEEHERAYVALMRGGFGFDDEVSRICEESRELILARMLEGVDASKLPPLFRHVLRGWIGFAEGGRHRLGDHQEGLARSRARHASPRRSSIS